MQVTTIPGPYSSGSVSATTVVVLVLLTGVLLPVFENA